MDTLESYLNYCSSPDFLKLSELLHKSPEIVNTKDSRLGLSPLFYAIISRDSKLIEFLLDHGAEVNISNSIGDTPLHEAADHSLPAVVKLLIAHKAKLNVENNEGETPLHNAAYRGDSESIEYLLQAGACINARNKLMRTPLHLAVISCHFSCVNLLLKYGANSDLIDAQSLNPKEIAESQGFGDLLDCKTPELYSIKEASEENTASLNSLNNYDQTLEQPDLELSICQSNLKDLHLFLIKNGLEECFEALKNIAIYDVPKLLSSDLDLEILVSNGVSRIGKAINLIIKIQEIQGSLQEIHVKFPDNPVSINCCSNELFASCVVLSVEEWLRILNLDEEIEVFRKAGYFDLEILYKQMHTKYPVNHAFLKELGVSSEKNRRIIIKALKKESQLNLGKNLQREKPGLICSCVLF